MVKRVLVCRTLWLLFCVIFGSHVYAGVLVMNGLTHEYEGSLGKTIKGEVVLKNTGQNPQDVKLYQRDYTFDATGATFFPEPGSLDRSNANWLSLESTYLTLAPGEEQLVAYEMIIPPDVSFDGTFWSVIIVESTDPISDLPTSKGLHVNTVIRYAIQVITHIDQTGTKELIFLDYEVVKDTTSLQLTIKLENVGERLLKPDVTAEFFDLDGRQIAKLEAGTKKLYPGTSQVFNLPLSDLLSGQYQTLILADCGNEDLYGANVELEIQQP